MKSVTTKIKLPAYKPVESKEFAAKREAAFRALAKLEVPSDKKYTSWDRYKLLERIAGLEIGGVDPTFELDQTENEEGLRAFALPLSKAIADWPEKAIEFMQAALPADDHYFSALSAAYYRTGAVIVVPAGVKADITTHFTAESGKLNAYRTILIVNPRAEVNYTEELGGNLGDETAVAHGVEVYAMADAKVNFHSLQRWPETVLNFAAYRAKVDRNARLNWLQGMFGSGFTQMHVESQLVKEGAETKVQSVFYGNAKQHFDQTLLANHVVGHTTSDTYTRGVLTDQARGVYRGMIAIQRGAHGSSADQNGHAMLLADTAHADMIPGLEIDADDVTAGHGATVGQVDAEQLFYLMSRGLPEADAREMIIRGFFEDMFKSVPLELVKAKYWEAVEAKRG